MTIQAVAVVPQTPCAVCSHVRAFHSSGMACRMGGCLCEEFGLSLIEKAQQRRVTFDIPDGYMVTVSLVPYTQEAIEAEADNGG